MDDGTQIRQVLWDTARCALCFVLTTMSQPDTSQDPSKDPRAANKAQFELELEFVQSLANPYYLHSLAQQGVLNQPAFVNFLKYLLYWKEKDYARFILYVRAIFSLYFYLTSCRYPHALHHLELLQHAKFRSEIAKDEWREYLNQKQFDHWRTWHASTPICRCHLVF